MDSYWDHPEGKSEERFKTSESYDSTAKNPRYLDQGHA